MSNVVQFHIQCTEQKTRRVYGYAYPNDRMEVTTMATKHRFYFADDTDTYPHAGVVGFTMQIQADDTAFEVGKVYRVTIEAADPDAA